ncbi:SpoIIE family protein phosphatase [Streptomyces sp. NPDC004065]|uniref:SpoIIE family protein phosphatase n=1 Tax=Streptomyces sp. NPDC004065 TaxID=3364689 RepID=UPI00384A9E10
MTGEAEEADRTAGRLAALLADASVEAIGAAGGFAGGVYLRSGTPGLLRLAVLAGLPCPLFRAWWRMHVNRGFPVADAYRLGAQVVLPNATETMRRYPQFAAGLPFQFGTLCVPVAGPKANFGVLAALRPAAADAAEMLPGRDRLARVAEDLGAALSGLDGEDTPVVWDREPLCVRPPAAGGHEERIGRFSWDPATDTVTADDGFLLLLGLSREAFPGTGRALADTVTCDDGHRMLAALREAASGRAPVLPLRVRTGEGAPRLMELWTSYAASSPAAYRVNGLVRDAGPGTVGDAAADLLPDGVFCVDRQGVVVYANPRAAQLLGRPRRSLVGRSLWDSVPWLAHPSCEDPLRAALLSREPVRFQARRPYGGAGTVPPRHGGGSGLLTLTAHAGPDLLTCTVRPAGATAGPDAPPAAPGPTAPGAAPDASAVAAPGGAPPGPRAAPPGPDAAPPDLDAAPPELDAAPADPDAAPAAGPVSAAAHLYRPIVLAIALTEAVTARQVSAVVMEELLPAFGGNRLAIYLLQERHLYLAWETGFPDGFLAPFEGVGLDARIPGVETLTTGRPLFFDSMAQLAAQYPGLPLDAEVGSRAFLPLIASGRPVGSCILGFDRPRSFSGEERAVLTALAGLIAHAMEKAQRYDTEAALARGLQQALLPRRLSAHPEVETAGRYLPGTQGMEVGGDWYDVVAAGDGLALVIGDVQGHGVQAAATMGQLRSAVKAFALSDRPPDEVMSGTNHLLIDLDPGQFASCCYIRLDPATGLVRIARAGHPLPLLRHPDGRTEVCDTPGGVVLGVDPGAQYPVAELRLERGAILALYTDGLVERPGLDIDEGVGALRTALARMGSSAAHPGGQSLTNVADRLTATARHTADRPDDIALLLARRCPAPRPRR